MTLLFKPFSMLASVLGGLLAGAHPHLARRKRAERGPGPRLH